MTSKEISKEDNDRLETALTNCLVSHRMASLAIDNLSSSSLKKALKAVTSIYTLTDLMGDKIPELSEDEQHTINKCFKFMTDLTGFDQLHNEIHGERIQKIDKGESNE